MNSKLIICIDGLGKDLISKENTPFLYDFGKKYYFSELETLFAFTGLEYCFFSGKTPDKTNIWLEFSKGDNSIFNNALLRFFSFNKKIRDYLGALIQYTKGRTWMSGLYNIPKDKLKYFDTSAKRGLWELDFFNDKKFAFYKWPFFVTDKRKKLIFKYEDDEDRLQRLLSEKGKEIYYVQIMKIDKAIHKFGKRSGGVGETLKKTDLLLERYVKKFLNENPDGKVFLWGDHSFADIKNYIYLEGLLPKSKEYLFFIEGTTASFWFKNEEIKKNVLESIKKERKIKVLNEEKAKEYKIPLSREYGDLVIYVEKGNYFFPNFYQKNENEKFTAMHGYPDDREMNGMVISNKKIPKKIKMADMINYIKC